MLRILADIVDRYSRLWNNYSRTIRISTVESISYEERWPDVEQFIARYGSDLLYAKMLTLSHVRAVLHAGLDDYIDYLEEHVHPHQPVALLTAMERREISRSNAAAILEWIYDLVMERVDRYVEYNTTTTQSDYGEKFFSLLDFIRVEVGYERSDWRLMPLATAHEVLARSGKKGQAQLWEKLLAHRTDEIAGKYLEELAELEKKHGMRLPSISDRLNERFVKPLAVDRMVALIPQALADARRTPPRGEAFRQLVAEIDQYLNSTSGSTVDLPGWLKTLDQEISRAEDGPNFWDEQTDHEATFPPAAIRIGQLRRQVDTWDRPTSRGTGEA